MLVLALALLGLALFFAPHRGRQAPASKRTLAGAALDLLRHLRGTRLPRALPLLALGGLGCCGVFLPAVLVAMVRAMSPAAPWLFWVGAAVLLLATVSTWLVLHLSRITFGFGSSSARDATVFAPVILAWLGSATVAAAAGALHHDFAAWLAGG